MRFYLSHEPHPTNRGRGFIIILLLAINLFGSFTFLAVSYHGGNNSVIPVYVSKTLFLPSQQPKEDAPSNSFIREFSVPTQNSGPEALIATPGAIWFTEFAAGKVGEFFVANSTFREFTIPENGAMPAALAIDNFGKIWFADQKNPGSIWSLNPSNGSFTQYKTKTVNSVPLFILVDTKNNIWFTELYGNSIGELSYPTYSMSEYPFPTQSSGQSSGPAELAMQNGSSTIWVTETYANKIAKFDTATHTVQEFTPSVSLKSPVGITLDTSGDVWVSEHGGSSVVEFNPKTSIFKKYVTSLPPRAGTYDNSAPATIAVDKQGILWFVEHFANEVGRLNPNSSTIDEFVIPNPGEYAYSVLNGLDSDGNFWFTQFSANAIGEVFHNATSPVTVVGQQSNLKSSVNAGQQVTANYFVSNSLQSSVHVTLNFSSSFSSTGQTSTSQVGLNSSSLTLGPGQNTSISATITPNSTLTSGLYSVGVTATYGNTSSTGLIFLQVQGMSVPGGLEVVAQYLPEIAIAVIVVLGFSYIVFLRKRVVDKTLGNTNLLCSLSLFATWALATSGGIFVFILYLELNPSLFVYAKCPGLPPVGPAGGPNYLGIALDIAFFAVPAYFLYIILKDMFRGRKRQQKK